MSTFSNAIQRGDRASQPAAGDVIVGTLYFVTDEGVIERSTGVAWESFSGAGDASAGVLLGRRSGSAGLIEEVTLDSDLALSAGAVLSTVSGILVANRVLTNAEILTLFSVPIEFVPAPGAGFVLLPLYWQYSADFTAGALSGSQTPTLTMGLWGAIFFDAVFWSSATKKFHAEVFSSFRGTTGDFEDTSIQITANVDRTGGNAANTADMKLWYMKVPVL